MNSTNSKQNKVKQSLLKTAQYIAKQ